ncbi:MAG: 50S ribosomal protein L31e [Candidatus Ranarchaeia archaeon]
MDSQDKEISADASEEEMPIKDSIVEEEVEDEEGGPGIETALPSGRPTAPLEMPEDVVFVEERLYVVPFRRLVYVPVKRRAKKAITILREFASRHMKSEYVLIHPRVNEQVWSRGISKPPRRLRVRLAKDTEGVIHVLPTES